MSIVPNLSLAHALGAIMLALTVFAQPANAMQPEEARHLLHRTGFGVSHSQWQSIIDLDYDAAVDKLVSEATRGQTVKAPQWTDEKPLWTVRQSGWTTEQRRELRLNKRAKIAELRHWWILQMLATPTPLRERMTLFWSNHFTTQYNKIFAPMLVFNQHEMLRSHALGHFDKMLFDVLQDPAMLLYLDNDKNNLNSVNENLARELMELFTLGEGNYSEDDVKEAARCLTGWGVKRDTGEFRILNKRHDARSKTVLGHSGKYSGDDLARLLLEQPATAERIVRKLWLEFVSLEPNESVVKIWALEFSKSNYAVDALLKTIFKSPQFRSVENRGVLIKSPSELFVGLMRPALDGLNPEQIRVRVSELRPGKRLPQLFRNAGQNLFEPPSVEGWPGGLEWVDSRTVLAREHTARNLVVGLADQKRGSTNPYLISSSGKNSKGRLITHLNAVDPVSHIPTTYTQQRMLLELIRDPAVHVK